MTGSRTEDAVRDDALLTPLQAAQDDYAGWYRLALLMTGDPQRAEDCVQDVVVSLLSGPRRVVAAGSARAYVRTAVVNRARSAHRRTATERKHLWRQRVDEVGPDHGEGLVLRDAVLAALQRLPDRQRAVLVLRYYAGATDDEIGRTLGIRTSTVRSTAMRALRSVRQDWEDDDE
jgi:RNA polymerase sigma factor (sigma-70 family)